ncbi:MAG: non-ribosomal peptide synthetase, partial [bacterium]|nr:non-ribosomal peptide synthetase [bacterium]
LTHALRQLAETCEVTLFMVLLAALDALLYHYTGQTDIVIGTPVAGREHADLENQVGFYLNTLALRIDFDKKDSFTRLLKRVEPVTLGAFEHKVYPFDKLVEDLVVERDPGRHPLFDVMVDMSNLTGSNPGSDLPEGTDDLKAVMTDTGYKSCKFDLTLYIAEGKSMLTTGFEYNTDLFNKERIEEMSKRFRSLLERIAENPDTPVADLELEDAFRKEIPTIIPRRQKRRKS